MKQFTISQKIYMGVKRVIDINSVILVVFDFMHCD